MNFDLQELEPFPTLMKRPVLSEAELEQCRRVLLDLQAREAANEALAVPSTGGRNKGVRRYRNNTAHIVDKCLPFDYW